MKVAGMRGWQETSECEQVLFSDGSFSLSAINRKMMFHSLLKFFDIDSGMERVRTCSLIRKFNFLFLSPPDQFLNWNLFFWVEWKACCSEHWIYYCFHTRQTCHARKNLTGPIPKICIIICSEWCKISHERIINTGKNLNFPLPIRFVT